MKALPIQTDPVYTKPAAPSRLHRWLSGFMQDERDGHARCLLLTPAHGHDAAAGGTALRARPAGAALWAVAGLYLAMGNLRFKGPFGLMLPCTSHRMLFKKLYASPFSKPVSSRG